MNKLIFLLFTLFFIAPSLFAQSNEASLDEKIGEMLMIGFKGYEVSDTSHIVRDIEDYHLGGVVLFDYDVPTDRPVRNVESPDQLVNLITQLNNLTDRKLFIAVDQEGGRVARLKESRGFIPNVSAEYLGEIDNVDSTRYYAETMADQLDELGFNINFAPVVDLNINPDNPVIGRIERSFSADPDAVVKHASIFLNEFNEHNILGVLKHYPGHGSAWNDSHVGMADVTETWQESELEPYRDLIQTDNRFAIMTAHVLNENLDAEWPATLSEEVQTNILRNQLGFEGVLFSDDMQMEAIRSFYGLETAITRAINAGVDVLVFGNNSVYWPDVVPQAVEIIKQKVESGEIPEDRIDTSYRRIMNAKNSL
ncbi:glycoside hydrolase family 3 protein [Rhodohalobacter sulfatireducens]|uniref:beta-N-acetylhexosaminidase n=1 Tax=Rhodohalobacter sulfatireducens TaxID=2911366 RepID=A0ABS9KFC0_9BACT|nr:glycoside hydrolase family 3 N-terminal domain-containing protein [Rhodohalobacter sulfatireducens]MCG2589546.1 glycoside hydrolase family 3 [Rhodohalobacter sulfatireducens]